MIFGARKCERAGAKAVRGLHIRERSRTRAARGSLAVLTLVVALLLPGSSATASAKSFVWSGDSAETRWSAIKNWGGEVAPSSGQPIELEFPHIPGCTGSCYDSKNDLSGLDVEAMAIDDGDEYELSGEEIDLGSGGLTISPGAGTSGSAGDLLELPIRLSESQTWSIAGRPAGQLGETGAAVFGKLSGQSSDLTTSLANGAELVLENETEVGAVALKGADTGEAAVLNGFIAFFGDLDFHDGNQVDLDHAALIGAGTMGALQTDQAELLVGTGTIPAEGIVADSVTLDAGSEATFQIAGAESRVGYDYSQLASLGAVDLAGATLAVDVKPASAQSNACPTLRQGQTFTFVSTPAALSGTFANAPEGGPEIPITFAARCGQRTQTMRIAYHRSGATETVTGTVEAAAAERQEEHERQEREQRERERQQQEERERQQREREKSDQLTEEEVRKVSEANAREAARAQQEVKEREEQVNKELVQKVEEAAHEHEPADTRPDSGGNATLTSSTLVENGGNRVLVKLACKGAGACRGKLTLATKGRRASKIGAADFSIAAGEKATVTIRLTAAGRALLRAAHDRLDATLAIVTDGASHRHADAVRLRPGGK